jgi:hypothetical protein
MLGTSAFSVRTEFSVGTGDQSEKGNKKRAHRDTTRISRMIRTSPFSARTDFSVTTGQIKLTESQDPHSWGARSRIAAMRAQVSEAS